MIPFGIRGGPQVNVLIREVMLDNENNVGCDIGPICNYSIKRTTLLKFSDNYMYRSDYGTLAQYNEIIMCAYFLHS